MDRVQKLTQCVDFKNFFADDGDDGTSAGCHEMFGEMFSNFEKTWVACGPRLAVINNSDCSLRSAWTFGAGQNDLKPVIKCVVELCVSNCPSSLLLVGLEASLGYSLLCVYHPLSRRVIRTLKLDLNIRSMTIISDGDGLVNPLPDILDRLEGVLAIGSDNGLVVLVDLSRNFINGVLDGDFDSVVDESCPKKLCLIDCQTDSPATIHAKMEQCQNRGDSIAVPLNDYESGVMVPHNLPESSVTCLYYCKEASSLLVGYSTGCWQMWNLTTFCLLYTSPRLKGSCPLFIHGFSVLEPCDDPRHTLYIWVTHQPLSSIVERVNPLVGMYTAHFKDKNPVKDYGTYYQNLLQCALSFEMELTFDPDNSGGDSSVVSCCSISKSVSRTLIHFSIYQDPEPLPLRLFVSIWEAWSCSRERLETYVTLFDLNQWYREQMPAVIRRSVTDCPYLVTKNFPVGKSVAAGVPPDSLAVYTSAQPLEQHFYPSAMSLDCVIVDDGGLVHYRCKGIQERTLSELTTYGSVALVRPTSVFKAVVGASLVPIYGEQLDVDHPNVDDQRNYVLTVCLENNLSSTLLSCADHWFNGSHSVTGCTLGYLFDFLWDTLTNYKRHFDIISSSLFDQSGVAFDTNSRRRLQHCKFMMETIESVYSKISKKYNAYIMSDNVNQRLEAMQLMLLYYEMVIWFIGVDALPEQSSRGTPASSIPYNFDKLFLFCVKRREELKNGLGSRKSGSCGGATDYCRLLIDSLMEEEAGDRVGDQWEVEGGSEAARLYPPPSVQSLLRVCLMSGIAQSTKHDIIMYFLLDLVDLADYDKYQKSIDAILKYRFHFGISEGHSRVIQAFWYLDHALFEDGIQCLLNPSVNRSDLHGWQHRAVLRLLIRQSQNRLALRYLHVKRPSLNLPDDVRLEMGLLLSNGLITQAFMFQRSNRHLRESLLNQFFKGCLENNTLKTVFDLQLDKFEEEAFVKFLKSAHLKNSDSLQVLYLLSRAKYVDAIELHDKLNRQRSRTGGVTMNSTLEKRHPMYHRYTREDSSGFRTTGLVVKGIAGTICDIRQSVAKAASKIDPLLSRMSGKPPRPLSTSLKMSLDRGEVPNLMNTQDELITLTLAHAKHLEISLAQSDRNRLIAEEDSEAGSWSRKRRPADDLTTSTAKKTKVAVEVELSEDKLKRTPGRVGSPGGYQADVERMVSTPLVERKDRILYPSRTTQKPLSILKTMSPSTPALRSRSKGGHPGPVDSRDQESIVSKVIRFQLPRDSDEHLPMELDEGKTAEEPEVGEDKEEREIVGETGPDIVEDPVKERSPDVEQPPDDTSHRPFKVSGRKSLRQLEATPPPRRRKPSETSLSATPIDGASTPSYRDRLRTRSASKVSSTPSTSAKGGSAVKTNDKEAISEWAQEAHEEANKVLFSYDDTPSKSPSRRTRKSPGGGSSNRSIRGRRSASSIVANTTFTSTTDTRVNSSVLEECGGKVLEETNKIEAFLREKELGDGVKEGESSPKVSEGLIERIPAKKEVVEDKLSREASEEESSASEGKKVNLEMVQGAVGNIVHKEDTTRRTRLGKSPKRQITEVTPRREGTPDLEGRGTTRSEKNRPQDKSPKRNREALEISNRRRIGSAREVEVSRESPKKKLGRLDTPSGKVTLLSGENNPQEALDFEEDVEEGKTRVEDMNSEIEAAQFAEEGKLVGDTVGEHEETTRLPEGLEVEVTPLREEGEIATRADLANDNGSEEVRAEVAVAIKDSGERLKEEETVQRASRGSPEIGAGREEAEDEEEEEMSYATLQPLYPGIIESSTKSFLDGARASKDPEVINLDSGGEQEEEKDSEDTELDRDFNNYRNAQVASTGLVISSVFSGVGHDFDDWGGSDKPTEDESEDGEDIYAGLDEHEEDEEDHYEGGEEEEEEEEEDQCEEEDDVSEDSGEDDKEDDSDVICLDSDSENSKSPEEEEEEENLSCGRPASEEDSKSDMITSSTGSKTGAEPRSSLMPQEEDSEQNSESEERINAVPSIEASSLIVQQLASSTKVEIATAPEDNQGRPDMATSSVEAMNADEQDMELPKDVSGSKLEGVASVQDIQPNDRNDASRASNDKIETDHCVGESRIVTSTTEVKTLVGGQTKDLEEPGAEGAVDEPPKEVIAGELLTDGTEAVTTSKFTEPESSRRGDEHIFFTEEVRPSTSFERVTEVSFREEISIEEIGSDEEDGELAEISDRHVVIWEEESGIIEEVNLSREEDPLGVAPPCPVEPTVVDMKATLQSTSVKTPAKCISPEVKAVETVTESISPVKTTAESVSQTKSAVEIVPPVETAAEIISPVETTVESTSSVKTATEITSPVETTVENILPVITSVVSTSPVETVVVNTLAAQTIVESTSLAETPVETTVQSISPVKTAVESALPVRTLVESKSPVETTVENTLQAKNTVESTSQVEIASDRVSEDIEVEVKTTAAKGIPLNEQRSTGVEEEVPLESATPNIGPEMKDPQQDGVDKFKLGPKPAEEISTEDNIQPAQAPPEGSGGCRLDEARIMTPVPTPRSESRSSFCDNSEASSAGAGDIAMIGSYSDEDSRDTVEFSQSIIEDQMIANSHGKDDLASVNAVAAPASPRLATPGESSPGSHFKEQDASPDNEVDVRGGKKMSSDSNATSEKVLRSRKSLLPKDENENRPSPSSRSTHPPVEVPETEAVSDARPEHGRMSMDRSMMTERVLRSRRSLLPEDKGEQVSSSPKINPQEKFVDLKVEGSEELIDEKQVGRKRMSIDRSMMTEKVLRSRKSLLPADKAEKRPESSSSKNDPPEKFVGLKVEGSEALIDEKAEGRKRMSVDRSMMTEKVLRSRKSLLPVDKEEKRPESPSSKSKQLEKCEHLEGGGSETLITEKQDDRKRMSIDRSMMTEKVLRSRKSLLPKDKEEKRPESPSSKGNQAEKCEDLEGEGSETLVTEKREDKKRMSIDRSMMTEKVLRSRKSLLPKDKEEKRSESPSSKGNQPEKCEGEGSETLITEKREDRKRISMDRSMIGKKPGTPPKLTKTVGDEDDMRLCLNLEEDSSRETTPRKRRASSLQPESVEEKGFRKLRKKSVSFSDIRIEIVQEPTLDESTIGGYSREQSRLSAKHHRRTSKTHRARREASTSSDDEQSNDVSRHPRALKKGQAGPSKAPQYKGAHRAKKTDYSSSENEDEKMPRPRRRSSVVGDQELSKGSRPEGHLPLEEEKIKLHSTKAQKRRSSTTEQHNRRSPSKDPLAGLRMTSDRMLKIMKSEEHLSSDEESNKRSSRGKSRKSEEARQPKERPPSRMSSEQDIRITVLKKSVDDSKRKSRSNSGEEMETSRPRKKASSVAGFPIARKRSSVMGRLSTLPDIAEETAVDATPPSRKPRKSLSLQSLEEKSPGKSGSNFAAWEAMDVSALNRIKKWIGEQDPGAHKSVIAPMETPPSRRRLTRAVFSPLEIVDSSEDDRPKSPHGLTSWGRSASPNLDSASVTSETSGKLLRSGKVVEDSPVSTPKKSPRRSSRRSTGGETPTRDDSGSDLSSITRSRRTTGKSLPEQMEKAADTPETGTPETRRAAEKKSKRH